MAALLLTVITLLIGSVNTRIDDLQGTVNTRISDVHSRIGDLNDRVTGVESRIDELNDRMTGIENGMRELRNLLIEALKAEPPATETSQPRAGRHRARRPPTRKRIPRNPGQTASYREAPHMSRAPSEHAQEYRETIKRAAELRSWL